MKTTARSLLLLLLTAFSLLLIAPAAFAAGPTPVATGSKVVFTVTADGTTPFVYTWQKAPAGSSTYVTIPDQTAATYTIPAAAAADAGNYRVIVANDYGTTTSTTATITAGTAPTIINFGVVVTASP